MNPMLEKLAHLHPEMVMLVGAAFCLLAGLSPSAALRRATPWVAAVTLLAAFGNAAREMWEPWGPNLPNAGGLTLSFATFVKLAATGMGLLLLLITAGLPMQLRQSRDAEHHHTTTFDPTLSLRGEFFAFFLLSLTGLMLTAGADDLVWLFLALELTSLPTYVMVATLRDRAIGQEAAVKYFFLGAMAAAVFLYGFTLIYGATGFTTFHAAPGTLGSAAYANIASVLADYRANHAGALPPLVLPGLLLAIIGLCFKIAAAPMHFYAADVYQGAASPVTAFLAFVPKAAGFAAIIILLRLTGYPATPLPVTLAALLWALAVLTMTLGNVLGLLQNSVKRVLAYSSIAHTGYLLVGLLGAGALTSTTPSLLVIGNGIGAVLFYLVAYGVATAGAFAVLGCLQARGEEADRYEDLHGLSARHPLLAAAMLLCVLSLIGIPPLVGFLGKIYLFGSAMKQGYVWLVIIAVVNSAVSAVYYLRIVNACYFGAPEPSLTAPAPPAALLHSPARRTGAIAAAVLSVLLGLTAHWLVTAANTAAIAQPSLSATPALPANATSPAPSTR